MYALPDLVSMVLNAKSLKCKIMNLFS